MANKIELVKSELAFHGIRVTDSGHCYSFMEGEDEPIQSTCSDKLSEIKYEIEENKRGCKQFWLKVCELLTATNDGTVGGSPITEKMFASALKQLHRFAKHYKYFARTAPIFKAALRSDSKKYTEAVMSQVIDYKICVDWLHHLVQNGTFVARLLSYYHRSIQKNVTAQQLTPSGIVEMDMKERVWEWEEDEEDWDNLAKNIRNQTRYTAGNDPEWLSQGFNWREPKNDPYLFGDEENDPYPHYYNFKSKVHKGVDR